MKRLFILPVLFVLTIFGFNSFAKEQSKTIANIKSAIIGETTASEKYAAYSNKAKEEGYVKIALLFEAASRSESIHANNHRAVLEQLGVKMDDFKPDYKVKTTKENLEDAYKGESYEVSTMYPGFLKIAQKEKVNLALISFNYAFQTEKKHQALYKNAIDQLKAGKDKDLAFKYMVCLTCGNTYDGEAPSRCGISMTPKERFVTIQ
jgi:rubrerythrin